MPEEPSHQPSAHPNPAQVTGLRLREARQARGLAIGDIAATLRIKPVFLEALEAGSPERLPTATHASGFLRSYARYLGIEHADAPQAPNNTYAAPPAPKLNPPTPTTVTLMPGWWASAVVPLGVLGGLAVLYLLWGWLQPAPPAPIVPPPETLGKLEPLDPTPDQDPAAPAAVSEAAPDHAPAQPSAAPAAAGLQTGLQTAPQTGSPAAQSALPQTPAAATPVASEDKPAVAPTARADAVKPTSTPTPTPAQTASQAQAQAQAPASAAPAAKIAVRALSDSWVQVTDANGKQLFSRLLRAGESWRAPTQAGLRLSTGNAGGLAIVRDGEQSAPLGANAQVIRNIPLTGRAEAAPAEDDFPFEDEAQ